VRRFTLLLTGTVRVGKTAERGHYVSGQRKKKDVEAAEVIVSNPGSGRSMIRICTHAGR
jgi:hypothetical protein